MEENVTRKGISGLLGDKMPQKRAEVSLPGIRASINQCRGFVKNKKLYIKTDFSLCLHF